MTMTDRKAKTLVAYYYLHPQYCTPEQVAEAHALLGLQPDAAHMAKYKKGRGVPQSVIEALPQSKWPTNPPGMIPILEHIQTQEDARISAILDAAGTEVESPLDFSTLSYRDLQAEAKARGIKGKHKQDELRALVIADLDGSE